MHGKLAEINLLERQQYEGLNMLLLCLEFMFKTALKVQFNHHSFLFVHQGQSSK